MQVEALRIQLGAVRVARCVQSDDLVSQHVVARLDVLGNLNQPSVTVLDELIVSPVARRGRAVDETLVGDLEEPQAGLVDGLAVAVASGQIVEDGA